MATISSTTEVATATQTTTKPHSVKLKECIPAKHERLTRGIEQKPLSITLSGPVLMVSILLLAVLIHSGAAYLTTTMLVLGLSLLFVKNDYDNFLRLGRGGIPSTPRGYLKVCWLKLFILRNTLTAPTSAPGQPGRGILKKGTLPRRAGSRPNTAGVAPHRQLNQHGSDAGFAALNRIFQKLVDTEPKSFKIQISALEKHGRALFAKAPLEDNYKGEICHMHDIDHSFHMFLHPEDIKEVLAAGWGERHPMAWHWGPWKPVGPKFLMVYGPRDEYELQAIGRIVEAAIWNRTGKTYKLDMAA